MFENLKAVCEYKTLCKVANRLPTYQCTYGDDIATHRCSEEKCPFMKPINEPITRARIRKPKAEFVKVKLEHNELPDEVLYNVFDETNKYLSVLVHKVSVKFNAHTDDHIIKAVQTVVGNHFTDDISIDKEKVIDAFDKYQKKHVRCNCKEHIYDNYVCFVAQFICPTCGCVIATRTSDNGPPKFTSVKNKHYCSECGQHLDWEVK